MHSIEIFPAEKTCEQGCAPCPLAKKDSIVTATQINSDVQDTFSFLENLFKKKKYLYNLHLTSSFHLSPALSHPKIINMSRFETNKDVRLNGNSKIYGDNIQTFLSDNKIAPKIIGFSIVPKSIIVNEDDMCVIKEIIDSIIPWYFKNRGTEIEVTIRSNFVKKLLMHENLGRVFQNDLEILPKLVQGYGTLDHYNMTNSYKKGESAYLYSNKFSAKAGNDWVSVYNRIISASNDVSDLKEKNRTQAMWFSPVKDVDYAIAPKGVMIEHSSVAINNPILWLSHNDFRKTLKMKVKNIKFSFAKFSQEIIQQNVVMYNWLYENNKEGINFTDKYFLANFEYYRPKFFN